MGDNFCFPNLGFKNSAKAGKLLFALFKVLGMKLIQEGLDVSVEKICVECGRHIVIFEKRCSALNHEKDVLYRGDVEA